jgi:uncharacterized protein (DUF2267 family)
MLNFEDYRVKGQKFYRRVARALGDGEDIGYADRLVTCLTHVLRERLSMRESLEFIAFLPMHIKAVYVNGWKPNSNPKRLRDVEEFLNAMRIKYPMTSGRKPGSNEEFKNDIRAVFSVIHADFASKGVANVRQWIPEILHELLPDTNIEAEKNINKDNPVVEVINEGGKHFPEVQPIKNEV